ncbi:MAG TPA: hypothetical protein VF957_09050, partial [Bradyrhizobium sp.]
VKKRGVAIVALTIARLGSRGITVHTVQPGPTETDMNPDENYPRRAATVARAGADRNCQPDRLRGEHRGEFRH